MPDKLEELKQRLKAQEERLERGEELLARGRELLAETKELLSKAPESDNPLSAKCERVLGTIPKCYDFRGIRRWVMCKAWDIMETRRVPFATSISEAWDKAKGVCSWE